MKCLLIFLLVFSFGESLNKFLKHYEPLNYQTADLHRVARSTVKRIRLHFHAYDRNFKLILYRVEEKDSVFMKNATAQFANETIPIQWDSNIFRGVVEDDDKSRVFGSIRHGIFEGVIYMRNGEEFWIESSYPYNSTSSFHSFIYSAGDVEMPKPTERTKRQGSYSYQDRPHYRNYPEDNDHYDHNTGYNHRNSGSSKKQNVFNHRGGSSSYYPETHYKYDPPRTTKLPPINNEDLPYNKCSKELKSPGEKSVRESMANYNYNRRQPGSEKEADENGIYRNRICSMSITIDHTLYQHVLNGAGRGDHGETYAELIKIMQTQFHLVNDIYVKIDFEGIKGIRFKIGGFKVWREATDIGNPFAVETRVSQEILDIQNKQNNTQHCLSYVFAYRDFDEGTNGLAYACHICLKYKNALNTGMITFLNYGSPITDRASHLTLAHELGHSLGSEHDYRPLHSGQMESDKHPECADDKIKGKFIMYAHPNDRTLPNHELLSPCSIRNISWNLHMLLSIKPGTPNSYQTNCFIESDTPICGNHIVEEGEECDCGYNSEECEKGARDQCCWPGDHRISPCKLKSDTFKCAPSQGKCCNELCQFKGPNAVCEWEKDCTAETKCLADSAVCPVGKPIHDGLPCNDATSVCVNGNCTGDICTAEGMQVCSPNKGSCIRHCSVDGKCTSTEDLDQFSTRNYSQKGRWGHRGLLKKANEGCKDGGYCDDIGVCRDMVTHDALAKGQVDHGIKTFGEYLEDNWWILILFVIAGIGILVLCSLLCYYKIPKLSRRSKRETKTIPIEVKPEVKAVEQKATDLQANPATPDASKVTGTVAPSTLTGQWIIPESKEKKDGK